MMNVILYAISMYDNAKTRTALSLCGDAKITHQPTRAPDDNTHTHTLASSVPTLPFRSVLGTLPIIRLIIIAPPFLFGVSFIWGFRSFFHAVLLLLHIVTVTAPRRRTFAWTPTLASPTHTRFAPPVVSHLKFRVRTLFTIYSSNLLSSYLRILFFLLPYFLPLFFSHSHSHLHLRLRFLDPGTLSLSPPPSLISSHLLG